ncbi:hypothetical protein M0804_014819 [Polistes exclamans]|nr:hypothetical protein M0804_014820 [Polistes exclamans]KAI4474507.1 hypothetical protein M0804_014819 [Polistes exclamans]
MPPVKLGLSGIYSKAGRFFACRELCPVQALRGGIRYFRIRIKRLTAFVSLELTSMQTLPNCKEKILTLLDPVRRRDQSFKVFERTSEANKQVSKLVSKQPSKQTSKQPRDLFFYRTPLGLFLFLFFFFFFFLFF